MIRSVMDAVRELKQMEDLLSNTKVVEEDDGKMVYKLSVCDMGTIRSVFDAYSDIIFNMKIKREETE